MASLRALARSPIARDLAGFADLTDSTLVQRTADAVPTTHGTRIVATLSWSGPPNGILFLLACNGRPLAIQPAGRVDSLDLRDADGDGFPDVIARARTGSGTGWRQDQTTVYRIVRDTLAVVWSAVTLEGDYNDGVGSVYELRAQVTFPSPGVITLTGDSGAVRLDEGRRDYVFARKPNHFVRRYRWSGARGSFVLVPR